MRRAPALWALAGAIALGVFLGLRGERPVTEAPTAPARDTPPMNAPPELPARAIMPLSENPSTEEQEPERRDEPTPATLEGLAQLALDHEGALAGCFEDAYRSQRLLKGRVHIRMQAGPTPEGQTRVHVTVPDTEEHLYDAEACLNGILRTAPLSPLQEDQETGVMWGLTLPIEQWGAPE